MSEKTNFVHQYLLEEMKAARQRIEAEINIMNRFEILSISVVGAIYFTFFQFKISNQSALVTLSLLPTLICVYGVFRYRAHADVVRIHEGYVKNIERQIQELDGSEKFQGLVTFYDAQKRSRLKYARYAFWTVMFLLSFTILILALFCPGHLATIHTKNS
jgi:hypothetical protein